MSQVFITSASSSNYEGMLALMDDHGWVYLGKSERYHPRPSPECSFYDNSDGSLQFISGNVKMYHFLYGDGWPLSQRQMRRKHCFCKADYIEYASLRDGVLARYPLIREVTFGGNPFVPPKAYRQRTKRGQPTAVH